MDRNAPPEDKPPKLTYDEYQQLQTKYHTDWTAQLSLSRAEGGYEQALGAMAEVLHEQISLALAQGEMSEHVTPLKQLLLTLCKVMNNLHDKHYVMSQFRLLHEQWEVYQQSQRSAEVTVPRGWSPRAQRVKG